MQAFINTYWYPGSDIFFFLFPLRLTLHQMKKKLILRKVAQHEIWVTEEMKMILNEGTSNEFREEQKAYYDAIQNRVRARSGEEVMFCEIGFNVGHSAVLVLESHPSAKYNGYSLRMDNSIKVPSHVLNFLSLHHASLWEFLRLLHNNITHVTHGGP